MSQQVPTKLSHQPDLGVATGSSHRLESARNTFLSSLTHDERALYAPCTSSKRLSESVQRLHILLTDNDRKNTVIGLLAKFHDAFEPYFKVINVFVSSNPDPGAIVWGALQLVLQVSRPARRRNRLTL